MLCCGALGSLLLPHCSHFITIIGLCAEQVYPKLTDYAVLGDDVLIADQAVAQKYHEVLGRFSFS